MSQISKLSILSALLVSGLIIIAAGCGSTSNPDTVFDAETGHPDNWLPELHKAEALANIDTCAECHGDTFDGGISGVACTSCHIGDALRVHPADWDTDGDGTINVINTHNNYVLQNGDTACSNAYCHGADFGGVAGSGTACTECHLGDERNIHPPGYFPHSDGTPGGTASFAPGSVFLTTPPSTCSNANCHGTDFQGVAGSGVDCFGCHHNSGFPNGCLTCHNDNDWST